MPSLARPQKPEEPGSCRHHQRDSRMVILSAVGRSIRYDKPSMSVMDHVYLTGFAEGLGERQPLETLTTVPHSVRKQLRTTGLEYVRKASEEAPALIYEMIHSTLADSVAPMPDAIIMAFPPQPGTLEGLESLFLDFPALHTTQLLSVGMNACADGGAGLMVAVGLCTSGLFTNILVIEGIENSQNQVSVDNLTVLSDGVASFFVSKVPPQAGYRLRAIASVRDHCLGMGALLVNQNERTLLERRWAILRRLGAEVSANGGVSIKDVAHVVTNNFALPYMKFIRHACGATNAHLHTEQLADRAHCRGAEIPMTLRLLLTSEFVGPADPILAIWSTFDSFFAALLTRC